MMRCTATPATVVWRGDVYYVPTHLSKGVWGQAFRLHRVGNPCLCYTSQAFEPNQSLAWTFIHGFVRHQGRTPRDT